MLKQFRIFLLLSLLLCFPSMVHGQEQRDSIRFRACLRRDSHSLVGTALQNHDERREHYKDSAAKAVYPGFDLFHLRHNGRNE